MTIFDEFRNRNILKAITNEDKILKLKKNDGVYIGFDPTADSLHLGNYLQIVNLKRFSSFGFKPYAVLGGATGMIGDPSGKKSERTLQTPDQIENNKRAIKIQLEKHGLNVLDNYDWYKDMSIIDFLRNIGKHLNLNYMMSKDSVKSRLDSGISFTEFSYQLIQGWDFKVLYEKYGITMQLGGSDQWGNITAGIELIRKTIGEDNRAIGGTLELLTTSTGEKFGKTSDGAIWIDENKTTPFEMYQYLLNSSDSDSEKLLMWLTNLSVEKIKEIIKTHSEKPFLRLAQKTLAHEVVSDIHGKSHIENIEKVNSVLFGKGDISKLNTNDVKSLDKIIPVFTTKNNLMIDVLLETKICTSKREVREFMESKTIEINGSNDINEESKIDFETWSGHAIIRKGKKNFYLLKKWN